MSTENLFLQARGYSVKRQTRKQDHRRSIRIVYSRSQTLYLPGSLSVYVNRELISSSAWLLSEETDQEAGPQEKYQDRLFPISNFIPPGIAFCLCQQRTYFF